MKEPHKAHPGEIDRMVGGARKMETGVSSPRYVPKQTRKVGKPPGLTK